MKLKILNSSLCLILLVQVAHSQVLKVDVQKDLTNKKAVDLFDGATKKGGKLSPLSQLKDHEVHLRWNDCIQSAPSVFKSQKELRGWVALSWLHCIDKAQEKKPQEAALAKALSAIGAEKDLLQKGPWSESLRAQWLELRLQQLESNVNKKIKNTDIQLEALLTDFADLNKEQKGKIYLLLGDVSLQKVNYPQAQFMYEEAQSYKDTKYLQEKLEFLSKIKPDVKAKPKTGAENSELTGEEVKIEDRVRQSAKSNEPIIAIRDAVNVLNNYPGSRSAKRLKDRPLEIYNSLTDSTVKNKALNEISDTDGTRLLDWAQIQHRRGDYDSALYLAQKAVEKNPASAQSTVALWIAGRCAHFTGHYDLALKHFKKLIEAYAGSEEAAEAAFRSGLIYFRNKEFSSAAAHFEKLLQQGRDRYDLVAQYWLIRAQQETKSPLAKTNMNALIEKYPFSYYGLRLKAESDGGKLSWPINSEKFSLKSDLYLVGEQKKSWQRFKSLAQAGWVTEAQTELGLLPFVKDPTLKISLAEQAARFQQYAMAIRWINEALEADPRLRKEQFMKWGYPKAFNELYQAEAARYGISADLLRSLTRQESAFNLRAVSTSNALGLMQMIPPTAQEVAKKLGLRIEIPEDMYRPDVNIPMGSFYFSQMLDQFQGNVPFALAAYNAGPHRLKNWLEGRKDVMDLVEKRSSLPMDEVWFDELPWSETSFYVKAILRNVLLYRLVDDGSFNLKPVLWQDLLNKKAK